MDLASFRSNYPKAVNHIGVGVDNLDCAVDWYCAVLGLSLEGSFRGSSDNCL